MMSLSARTWVQTSLPLRNLFFFPPLPLLLSVIDGVMGWRGFLLVKNVQNSPHMWEQPRFPGLMLATPHELQTGHDRLWGLDLLWGNQEVLVNRTLEKHKDGWRGVEILLLGWTALWNTSSGKTEANSIQCKEWIYVPGPAARTCWMHPRSVVLLI